MIKRERVAKPVEYVETDVQVCDACGGTQVLPNSHYYLLSGGWSCFSDGKTRDGKFHFCPACTPSIVKLLEDARL